MLLRFVNHYCRYNAGAVDWIADHRIVRHVLDSGLAVPAEQAKPTRKARRNATAQPKPAPASANNDDGQGRDAASELS